MSADYDVVVVGGGMAGLSAALTAGRLGRSVALLSSGVPGGQLLSIEHIDGVPGYAEGVAGYDLCPITQEQCDAVGVTLITDPCERIAASDSGWTVSGPGGDVTARGLIIASGTALAKLGVPGEEEYEGRGVSDCASCDAPLLRNKTAVVAGGGDSAMQEALVVADHAAKVILVTNGDGLHGQADYRERIEGNGKIELRLRSEVTEVLGEASGVTAVKIRDIASGTEEEVATDALFVFIGLVPNSAFLGGVVPLDAKGHVMVDPGLRTSVPGICAAGNVRSAGSFRAAGVMGDGALAAKTIDDYLTTGTWQTPG
ncbi:MAG: FAD-dependent oxidoreductase [Sphingomonadales bacterium]|nr:FAD-dependent oxidoreductase [Sphingomonadales bacterium]